MPITLPTARGLLATLGGRLRFDRHELAGAFGDVGTDLPLLVGLVVTCQLDPTSVFTVFGLLQIAMGLLYGIPMPVQPLKAMAAIMLASKLSQGALTAGGLIIGATMLLLTASGLLERITKLVPRVVVRGVQLGLGLSLATIALKDYTARDGASGYILAAVAVVALLVLRRQKRIPAPLIVLGMGAIYGLLSHPATGGLALSVGLTVPSFRVPSGTEWLQGALLLALPQLPLSLGNSVIATSQTSADLFPQRAVGVRQIGLTYGVMNLVAPLFGGVPVCHGCGGMVGFYGFGGRTGGAPVIYGTFYVLLGTLFAHGFENVIRIFPMPILGVVLLFEAVGLMSLVRDVASDPTKLWIAFAVAVAAIALPYGYAVGMVGGTLVAWAVGRNWMRAPSQESD
jgi:MFS superfamily sulfate permease-like transporter